MKFSFKSFAIGFGCAALSLGAVTYANAATNATLKACANKTTGAMRYISKGSCKKTEKALSWNQIGPQGANGQNFHVIDAAGRDLGPAVGLSDQGRSAIIIHEGGLWSIYSNTNIPRVALTPPESGAYADSSCSTPYMEVGEKEQSMTRGWNDDEVNPKYFKLVGEPFLMSSKVVYAKVSVEVRAPYTYTCTASTNPSFAAYFDARSFNLNARLSAVTEVTPPAYTAPFSIVAK